MVTFPCLVLVMAFLAFKSCSAFNLSMGSSLSVDHPSQTLTSPDAAFTAGFFPVGENAFCFGIWFTEPASTPLDEVTVVWIANRNVPVNGHRSKLSLHKNGNLLLHDVDGYIVWSSGTATSDSSPVRLHLKDSGNLVLLQDNGVVLWESFDSPTDTLLPHQRLTKNTQLVSSRSSTNRSSGFYSFFFDNDNTLRMLYNGAGTDVSSIYWPEPWRLPSDVGRTTFNNSRVARFDSLGQFNSSDNLTFRTLDYGTAKLQRIMRMDVDGNLRAYSRQGHGDNWIITWAAIRQPCIIHGICGPNSYCSYIPSTGRKCSCLPGYEKVSSIDWSRGCRPAAGFDLNSAEDEYGFLHLWRIEMYGYYYAKFEPYTVDGCKRMCLNLSNCTGFHIKYSGYDFQCYPKFQMTNGYLSPSFDGELYLKLPKAFLNATFEDSPQTCPANLTAKNERTYARSKPSIAIKFMIRFASAVGILEVICIFVVWFFVSRTRSGDKRDSELEALAQGYLQAASGFRRFTYAELKNATTGFREEIGRGGGGVVYKGELPDQRVAAVKKLSDCNQGEAEFLAEVSLLGKLYHMNLIEMWGYCVEDKHRLLVYEYMEHGSLAKSLASNVLDWKKMYDIALGTAKGLAYLHEECLEWVLHCDVKPHNILLDSDYIPKVADFGLSKLLNRGGENRNSDFSRIRGTRGYMAPEWVHNMAITSKVDVYSYGIVVLEMLTGKNPTESNRQSEMLTGGNALKKLMEQIKGDSIMVGDETELGKLEILAKVALKCIEEDRNARPSMSQVVELLLNYELHG